MFVKVLLIALCVSVCIHSESNENYVDAVIDMLLNGISREIEESDDINDDKEPVLSGGIWKCGNCENLDESRLMYSEINEVDDNMITDASVDIQLGFTLPGMQCITVQSDAAGLVRRVTGSCTSGVLTLSVSPIPHFTVQVYN